MRIYTLGTGHGNSTVSRFNSSTAYEAADGTIYLVDCGAPCEALLRRKGLDIGNVRALFVTHMHVDHTGGLSMLCAQVNKYPKRRTLPFSIHLPEASAIDGFKAWFSAIHENAEHPWLDFHATEMGAVYSDDNIEVSAIRTRHLYTNTSRSSSVSDGEPCSCSYVLYFKKEGIRVIHTGDLCHDFSDFPAEAQTTHFDVCVCEATHYKPEDSLETLRTADIGRLIFAHIGERWQLRVMGAWETVNVEKELLAYYTDLPYPVCVAHDGDEFLFT